MFKPTSAEVHASDKLNARYGDIFVKQKRPAGQFSEWKPGDMPVQFLTSHVLDQTILESARRGQAICYRATFFKRSPVFERTVTVWLFDSLQALKDNRDANKWLQTISRPVIAFYGPGPGTPSPESMHAISQMLRNSAALQCNDGEQVAGAWVFADRGGLGFYSTKGTKGSAASQFERFLICQMLVMAYADVLETTAQEFARLVSSKSGDGTALIQLYEDFLAFNAASYTERPVRRKSSAVYEFYSILRKHYGLDEIQSEIERQMRNLGEFLQAEQSRRVLEQQIALMEAERARATIEAEERKKTEAARRRDEQFQIRSARREKTLNWIVGVLGLIIAAASMPDQIFSGMASAVQEGWSRLF